MNTEVIVRAARAVPVLAILVAAGACGVDTTSSNPTWHRDVAPILARHCTSCHREGGAAPFALTDYETARLEAPRVLEAIESGTMPPFGARPDASCTPRLGWADDPRPTAYERQTLRRWLELGFEVGEPRVAPDPPPVGLVDVSTTVAPVEGWVASGPRDQFICYVLDPRVERDRWVTGLQVRPGVPEVVHHATIVAVSPGDDHDRLVSTFGIGRPFSCEAAGPVRSYGLHIWTPGSQPVQTPPELALPMPAGSKLFVEIHYHPHADTRPDVTAIDLRFSDRWPRKALTLLVYGNEGAAPRLLPGPGDDGPDPRFLIPRNAPAHVERMVSPNEFDYQIVSVSPHMHLLGTDLASWLRRADGDPECLISSTWNFDWQRTYYYDAALDVLPVVRAGDAIELQCTWDNSIANAFMSRWLTDANVRLPRDLALGASTLDEMCQISIGAAVPAPRSGALGEWMAATPAFRTPHVR